MNARTAMPMRHLDGTFTGHIWEGSPVNALRVHTSTSITIRRDTDGSWLAYVELDRGGTDDTSHGLEISDPAACRAFDALIELIANPIEFEGCRVDPTPTGPPQAAD